MTRDQAGLSGMAIPLMRGSSFDTHFMWRAASYPARAWSSGFASILAADSSPRPSASCTFFCDFSLAFSQSPDESKLVPILVQLRTEACESTCASPLYVDAGGIMRYQPTSASVAAWRRFIDIELADRRATDKWLTVRSPHDSHYRDRLQESARAQGCGACRAVNRATLSG